MKKFIFLASLYMWLASFATAQTKDGFAIVIDAQSLNEAGKEVQDYATAIEQTQHLKVFTVVDRWGVPDSIRACLQRMHQAKSYPLAGAVFMGDIPIPMVRDAQYLTSAFRMDQGRDWKESSVPSDRYYDDFGLTFDFLRRDSTESSYFYYSLRPDAAQRIQPDIFSGRIRPTDCDGTSRYEKLRNYLRKATAYKREKHNLNQVFFFTGSGSLTESRVAAMDEKMAYYEHFPWLLNQASQSIGYMDYSQKRFIKEKLMNELMRPDLDVAVLHHHGDWDTQYLSKSTLSGSPTDSLGKAMLDLHLEDFKGFGFEPNARFIILDACFNGSFHRENCIANEYIFSPGTTLAVIAGTVNVLQDKWYDRSIGLLGAGMFAGYINGIQGYLESHLIGDPTFTFQPQGNVPDLNKLLVDGGSSKALQALQRHPYADVRNLALALRCQQGKVSDEELLTLLKQAPTGIERLQALHLLADRRTSAFVKGLAIASQDRNEMTQRFAVNYMRQNGDESLIDPLIHLLISNNPSARVEFDADQALMFFPKDKLLAAFDRQFASVNYVHKDSVREHYVKLINSMGNSWEKEVKRLASDSLTDKSFNFTASCLRLYCPHNQVDKVLHYIQTTHNAKRQVALIEALGWLRYSYQAPRIAEKALDWSKDNSLADEVRREALKTYNRLK